MISTITIIINTIINSVIMFKNDTMINSDTIIGKDSFHEPHYILDKTIFFLMCFELI